VATAKSTRKHGFQPGKSGNPAGRPAGSRNKATLAIEALLDGDAEALTRKAVGMALEGDTVALRLCMDRICPPRKDSPISFKMPPVNSVSDAASVMRSVMEEVAMGSISPGEAKAVSEVLDCYRRLVETSEFEHRLTALEAGR
jgi:hypothetical protein